MKAHRYYDLLPPEYGAAVVNEANTLVAAVRDALRASLDAKATSGSYDFMAASRQVMRLVSEPGRSFCSMWPVFDFELSDHGTIFCRMPCLLSSTSCQMTTGHIFPSV